MLGSILKVLAYRQAPRTTFAMLHPDAAFQLAKMRYDFHNAYAPRVAAVAAAAIALPLGILLGRAVERGANRRSRQGTSASTFVSAPHERPRRSASHRTTAGAGRTVARRNLPAPGSSGARQVVNAEDR